jgi:prolyl-tRNA synthetase
MKTSPNILRQSKLVTQTKKSVAAEEVSVNASLLERGGFTSKLMAGVYSYLPLGLRVLTKIENIIREEMAALGSSEVLLPALHPRSIWDQTERWDLVDVLFKLKGAGDRDLALGPTHEEVVTPLVGQFINSYRDLPTSVFQIQTKFRNEARAKSGLLRGREFRMKDLYSFHTSSACLDAFYELAIEAYHSVFRRLGLGDITYLTYASGGTFSKYSHEFQTLTNSGEDKILLCSDCRVAINLEIFQDGSGCPTCGNRTELTEHKAIEVGNIFKLNRKFTDAFEVSVHDVSGESTPVLMGCYGIGTSRLVGAIVEALHDEKGIKWPMSVAPFQVHLLALGQDQSVFDACDAMAHNLGNNGIEVLYDDRANIRAGEKFADSDLIGIPIRVIISERSLKEGRCELKMRGAQDAEHLPLGDTAERINAIIRD